MEKKLDFEKELNTLNDIVKKIQENEVSLDESLQLYKKGNEIIAKLESALKEAESNVEKIIDCNKK